MTVQLSQHQINLFKTKLNDRFLALRREISEELQSADEQQFGDLAGQVYDTGEAALADLLVDIGLSTIDRQIQEIRDIDAALMRIAEGRYGECSDCQEPIAIERLQANPAASRCIICQQAHDRNFAHGAQPSL